MSGLTLDIVLFVAWIGCCLVMAFVSVRSYERQQRDQTERVRSEQLIATWCEKYVLGEIEIDALEEGIACALTGRSDAATNAAAEAIRDARMRPDEWFALAHERRLRATGLRLTE